MPHRIQVHPELVGVGLLVGLRGVDREHLGFTDVEIVDEEIDVELGRNRAIGVRTALVRRPTA